MPMFENSQKTDARASTFNDVGRDQIHGDQVNIHQAITINTDTLTLLNPVPDAVYDSIGAVSGCLAGTRQEVIGRIIQWIDGKSDQQICWLHGAAGSGKSAISKTIAELCAEKNKLGASFFFLRGAGRRSRITHFISTLAYHLAFSIPATKPYIETILQTDHHIVHRSFERQLGKLIIQPILSVNMPDLPMVIIVDALDECDDKEMIADFINVVAGAVRNHRLPLRFIFTSRDEDHIQTKFLTSPALDATYCLALHDFDAHDDILKFYRSRFSIIYQERRRLMKNITLPWPSEPVLAELVRKSSGSFIFAFTLVNFVNDGSDLPHRKLEAALESHAGLDPLYIQVLRNATRSPNFLRIFETIMTVTEDLLFVVDLAYLFQIETGDVILALLGVQSILVVPDDDRSPIRPFHTSLRDFLATQARSNELFINPPVRHLSIASDCLAVIVMHNENEFAEHTGLEFACRSWSHHLLLAIQHEGGDNFFFSQHNAFMMKLIDLVSRSFDLWVNVIIAQRRMIGTLKTLNSVVSILKELHQCPRDMLRIIEKIRVFAELDDISFCKDNKLRQMNYYDDRYWIIGGHWDDESIGGHRLVSMIREWRTSRAATTWSRFQSD